MQCRYAVFQEVECLHSNSKILTDLHHGFFLMGLKGNAEAYKWNEYLVVRV
jgi:hypothetical protein